MPFDTAVRSKLQKMTAACRKILTEEFVSQLQTVYGIQPNGEIADINLLDLDDETFATAKMLRERIEYLSGGPAGPLSAIKEAVLRVVREQAFTILNRLAALRMCEERGIVRECIRGGLNSEGFKVYCMSAGSGLGEAYHRYRTYLFCVFDEIAVDLKVLFDRFSPVGMLFPREPALLQVLGTLNDPELREIWKEDETIGWVYQYFNPPEERKAMRETSHAPRNSRELAVRNQFFTPRYVVEFLTDNTLGHIWYEMRQGNTSLKEECRYLVRRPDEIFLSRMTVDDRKISEIAALLQGGTEGTFPAFASDRDSDRMCNLAHCVDGYKRHPSEDKVEGEWWPWWRKQKIRQGESIENVSTLDLMDVLFAKARAYCHGGNAEEWEEPLTLQIANEIRRRVLNSRREDLSQEEILKQPVFIPYRAPKDPRDLRVLDPACGSGHFLLYTFDLLERIYEEARSDPESPKSEITGRTLQEDFGTLDDLRQEIPKLIIEHNLHGIDIDSRAVQIAALALWLRAQKRWKELGLKPDERPLITRSQIVTAEPMPGNKDLLEDFARSFKGEYRIVGELVRTVWDKMQLAGEAGSLLQVEKDIRDSVEKGKEEWERAKVGDKLRQSNLFRPISPRQSDMREALAKVKRSEFWDEAEDLITEATGQFAGSNRGSYRRKLFAEDAAAGFAFIELCRKRFDIVLMNPPFGEAEKGSKNYITETYPRTKNDLYASFVERGLHFLTNEGMLGAITSRTGFFLTSFTKWRQEILLREAHLSIMADLGYGVLDSALVETAAYCLRKV